MTHKKLNILPSGVSPSPPPPYSVRPSSPTSPLLSRWKSTIYEKGLWRPWAKHGWSLIKLVFGYQYLQASKKSQKWTRTRVSLLILITVQCLLPSINYFLPLMAIDDNKKCTRINIRWDLYDLISFWVLELIRILTRALLYPCLFEANICLFMKLGANNQV